MNIEEKLNYCRSEYKLYRAYFCNILGIYDSTFSRHFSNKSDYVMPQVVLDELDKLLDMTIEHMKVIKQEIKNHKLGQM